MPGNTPIGLLPTGLARGTTPAPGGSNSEAPETEVSTPPSTPPGATGQNGRASAPPLSSASDLSSAPHQSMVPPGRTESVPAPAGSVPAPAGSVPAPAGSVPAPADTAPGARRGKPAARRRNRTWFRIISPLVVLLGWQLVSMSGLISQQKLPPPSTVLHTAITLITTSNAAYGTLQGAMLVSLERVAIGFAVGGAAGLVLGVVAGLSRLGENSVDPLMQMLRTLPLFGLIPVFIVWFGIGQLPKILLIALGAAIPLYLNTFSGIRNVDAKLAEAGQSLGLRRGETIRHIILPGALPQILVGLRQSLGIAWLALVVAEQINANAGLGYIINQGQAFLNNSVIFVALLVYCVLGLLTDALVRLMERRALAWRHGLLDH
jgi:sulfonate transport system permease protein